MIAALTGEIISGPPADPGLTYPALHWLVIAAMALSVLSLLWWTLERLWVWWRYPHAMPEPDVTDSTPDPDEDPR